VPIASDMRVRAAPRPPSDAYARRDPRQTVLYQIVESHLPAFLEQAREHGGVPGFVQDAFQELLRCGVLSTACVAFAAALAAVSGWSRCLAKVAALPAHRLMRTGTRQHIASATKTSKRHERSSLLRTQDPVARHASARARLRRSLTYPLTSGPGFTLYWAAMPKCAVFRDDASLVFVNERGSARLDAVRAPGMTAKSLLGPSPAPYSEISEAGNDQTVDGRAHGSSATTGSPFIGTLEATSALLRKEDYIVKVAPYAPGESYTLEIRGHAAMPPAFSPGCSHSCRDSSRRTLGSSDRR
jgi:hypothetical protein